MDRLNMDPNFDSIFLGRIAKDVIKILSPQLSPGDNAHEELLRPLERFICDLNEDASPEDVAKILQQIQELNQPSKLCRKTLKAGDVSFICDDCGFDRTCVVCLDCFQRGPHKDHNYRMLHGSGGGCCDCGDPEAWKQNYACSNHLNPNQPNLSLSDFADIESRSKMILEDERNIAEKIQRLPIGVASKYYLVCQASLHYAQMMLTWGQSTLLPHPALDIQDDSDKQLSQLMSDDSTSKNYFTVLLNDEVHTYDHVIGTLVKVIHCTKMTASMMASTINREGRSLVVNDCLETCNKVKDMIASVRENALPLQVQVVHGKILAHQTFALKLIEWIRKMSSLCDGFKILTAFTLLGQSSLMMNHREEDFNMTLVEQIMLSNTTYWKSVRSEWNDLFVATLISDYSIKEKFARLITRNYPKLYTDFIQDDHDHSVSVLTMTTQLYTAPSLLCMLIEEENAMKIIAQTLIDTCKATKRDNPAITFESRNTFDMQALKRGFYIIEDLKYLINVKPTKWTPQLRRNVIDAVSIFIDLLSSMQGMDGVKRQLGQHLEYEPDWESGMSLQNRLVALITNLVTYCSYDEEVLIETLNLTQSRLLMNAGFKKVTKEFLSSNAHCIQYDVSTMPVSVHLPLTRFSAALMLELMKIRPIEKPCNPQSFLYDGSRVILTERISSLYQNPCSYMVEIMEQSLRTQVMIAQFRSGMWRRNGYSLVNQILYYHTPPMRKEMFDRDILVLQECLAMCDPNEFFVHLLNKFGLFNWFGTGCKIVPPKTVSFLNDEETMSLGEEFLQLLLIIISERHCVGVGKIAEEDAIKNEIIHLLCIGPSTRSEISRKLCVGDHEMDCIKSVADLKRSNEASSGKYELKDEYYAHFNPFFYHYSRRDQSNALSAQSKRKKSLGESLICCPPAKPVELTEQFSNLNNLLKCNLTFALKQTILTRAEGSQECDRFGASDQQLDLVLHLIGLGLWEQERNIKFEYIREAQERNIFKLLRECYEKTKRSKDLIYWLMKKTQDLVDYYIDNAKECDLSIYIDVKECLSPVLSKSDTTTKDKKKRNSEMAAKHQRRIMAMMRANQNKFLSNPETQQLMVETEKSEEAHNDEDENTSKNLTNSISKASHLCILCRDEQTIGFDQPLMVLLTYIQRSSVLSKNRSERRIPNYALTPSNQIKNHPKNSPNVYSFTSDNSWSFDATFMTSDLFFGPHISTCGHAMHYQCWKEFFDATIRRDTSRPNRSARHVSYELEKHEILCPLCECISNATLPILPNYTNFSKRSSSTIFQSSREIIEISSVNLSAFLHSLRGTVDMFKHIRHIKNVTTNLSFNEESKYMRLLQPKGINDVLEELDEVEALGLRDFINSIRSDRLTADSCSRVVLSSISTLADRIHSVGLDLGKEMSDIHHARVFMMTSWSISYTVQTYERVSRFKASPLFEDIDSSKNLCLQALLRFACSSMLTHQSDMIQSLLVKKLRYLLINGEHLSSSPCCLDIDAFETFVSIFILLQKLYAHLDDTTNTADEPNPSYAWATKAFDHEYFRNLLHLMVMLNMVQITVSMHNELSTETFNNSNNISSNSNNDSSSNNNDSSSSNTTTNEQIILHNFYKEIVMAAGHPFSTLPPVTETLVNKMKHRLLPFLRSCAIFFFHLSDIHPPDELRRREFEQSELREFEQRKLQEFDAICQYLVLPNDFSTLLQCQEARNLACSWLRHSRVLTLIKSSQSDLKTDTELMPVKFIRQPHSVNRLVDLPYEYSELLDKAFRPYVGNSACATPTSTMCLVCGAMLCSQCYSCQRDLNELASNCRSQHQQLVGSCTYHAHECSAGVGVFLRIRNSQILLMSGRTKGCYMPAPYIDDHGETDFGLMRGKPLHLNRQHYEKLQQMWLTHSIPEQISRTLEYSSYASSINWYLH